MSNLDYYDGGRLVRVPTGRISDSDRNIMADLAHEGERWDEDREEWVPED